MSHTFLTKAELDERTEAGARMVVDPEPRFLVTLKPKPFGFEGYRYDHVKSTQVHQGDHLELDDDVIDEVVGVWHKMEYGGHHGMQVGVDAVMFELASGKTRNYFGTEDKVWVLRR